MSCRINIFRMTSKNQIPLDDVSTQIFIGSLFGDGHIRNDGRHRHSFYVERHSIGESDYMKWKNAYLVFSYAERSQWTNKKQYGICEIRSGGIPWLTDVSSSFSISEDWLNRLDNLGLLVWYLDKGRKGTKKGLYAPCEPTTEQCHVITTWFTERCKTPVSMDLGPSGKKRNFIRLLEPVEFLMLMQIPFTQYHLPNSMNISVGLPTKRRYWRK